MNSKYTMALVLISQLFTACSYRNGEAFEDLYTDVKVVKPSSTHYKTSSKQDNSPILHDSTLNTKNREGEASVQIKETGRIIASSFDNEVKLYVYTLLPESSREHVVFFYDKALNFTSQTLIDVDILDNYLIEASVHEVKPALSIAEKKRYIKHLRKNNKIPPAYEVNIDTY